MGCWTEKMFGCRYAHGRPSGQLLGSYGTSCNHHASTDEVALRYVALMLRGDVQNDATVTCKYVGQSFSDIPFPNIH